MDATWEYLDSDWYSTSRALAAIILEDGTAIDLGDADTISAQFDVSSVERYRKNTATRVLGKKIARHGARVWLVNTGWTGGPYGVGRRMTIAYTRAMIAAALTGALDAVRYQRHPIFNVEMPTTCPGVPDAVLDPRRTWTDSTQYDTQARALARMFVENFKTFDADVTDAVRKAGPTV